MSQIIAPSTEAAPKRRSRKKKPISTGSEWTFELVERYHKEIARIAADFKLDTYPNQLEIITAEQMMDAYASELSALELWQAFHVYREKL